MPHDAQHAAPVPVARSRHTAAWITLASAGLTGMAYNLFHALNGGIGAVPAAAGHAGHPGHGISPAHGTSGLAVLLAVLLGIMPMTLAMLLTHVVGEAAEEWMRWGVLAVMLAAMYLSLSATATVVEGASGRGSARAYIFGGVLDAAALLAFRVITAGRKHEDAAAEAVTAAAAEARLARTAATAAEARAATAEAELGAAGTAHEDARHARAEAQESAARAGALEADLAGVRAQLDRALRALEKRPAAGAPRTRQQRASAGDDIATEFKVLDAVKANREISGKDLGAMVGVSEGHARKLKTAALAVLARDEAGQS